MSFFQMVMKSVSKKFKQAELTHVCTHIPGRDEEEEEEEEEEDSFLLKSMWLTYANFKKGLKWTFVYKNLKLLAV